VSQVVTSRKIRLPLSRVSEQWLLWLRRKFQAIYITAKFKSIEQFGSRSSTALLFGLMDCRDAEANRIGG